MKKEIEKKKKQYLYEEKPDPHHWILFCFLLEFMQGGRAGGGLGDIYNTVGIQGIAPFNLLAENAPKGHGMHGRQAWLHDFLRAAKLRRIMTRPHL